MKKALITRITGRDGSYLAESQRGGWWSRIEVCIG